MKRQHFDKSWLARVTGGLAIGANRPFWLLEPNGSADRAIDPDDVGATETPITAYTTKTGSKEISWPVRSDDDGQFPDVWLETGSYDVYVPGDAINPLTRWDGAVGRDVRVLMEAPLRLERFGGAGDGNEAGTLGTDNWPAFDRALELVRRSPVGEDEGGAELHLGRGCFRLAGGTPDFDMYSMSLSGEGYAATQIVIDHTDGDGLRWSKGHASWRDLRVIGSEERLANGDDRCHGIRVEPPDEADAEAVRMVSSIDAAAHFHPGCGLIIVSQGPTKRVDGGAYSDNGIHGIAVDSGELTGRVNPLVQPSGFVDIRGTTTTRNGGHGVAAGHPDDSLLVDRAGQIARVSVLQLDCGNNIVDRAVTQLDGAQSLPAATITVDDTSDFAESGLLWIDRMHVVAYTGRTSTTFTGCTGGDVLMVNHGIASVIAAGAMVEQPRVAYSLDQLWAHGQDHAIRNSAFGGSIDGNGSILVAGTNIVIDNNRFLGRPPYCVKVWSKGAYVTRGVRILDMHPIGNEPADPVLVDDSDGSISGLDVAQAGTVNMPGYVDLEGLAHSVRSPGGHYVERGSKFRSGIGSFEAVPIDDEEGVYIDLRPASRAAVVITPNAASGLGGFVNFRVGPSAYVSTEATRVVGATTSGSPGISSLAASRLHVLADTELPRLYIVNKTGARRGYDLTFLNASTGLVISDPVPFS